MGVYDRHVSAYAAAGLPVFPVDTKAKRPAVRGWREASPGRARQWAEVGRLGAMDGLGIVMGKPSGITEIDLDAVGDAWIATALDRFGETPVIIRTASGKAKLWYRHNGEGRHIRPFDGLPIDVLGGGFTIAPPSYRPDLGVAYQFVSGGLDDLRRLPVLRTDALPTTFARDPGSVRRGERNDSLWRYCMVQARFCDDLEALMDVATSWSDGFAEPLHPAEAERCARSAWDRQVRGRNYLGLRKPQITESDRIMDDLIDQPEAMVLLQYFQRWHSNRPSFAIAPRAMSAAGSPPWPWKQIGRCRDVLVERGYLLELQPPDARKGRSGRYRLSGVSKYGHNHNTFPPSLDPSLLVTG